MLVARCRIVPARMIRPGKPGTVAVFPKRLGPKPATADLSIEPLTVFQPADKPGSSFLVVNGYARLQALKSIAGVAGDAPARKDSNG
jgi:hypothetical protein